MRTIVTGLGAACLALMLGSCATSAAEAQTDRSLELSSCRPDGFQEDALCGAFNVPENRAVANGRMLPLHVIVLRARHDAGAGPVFYFSGGPGQAATESARWMVGSQMHENHDIVFVDLRGAGEGHRLDCVTNASDENLQSYLEPPLFSDRAAYAACRDALSQGADLTQYTTENSMRDIDEARQALGYERINIFGGSYGTRAALVYIRNHGQHVRSAYLSGVVPFENKNPLYHAPAAQRAFDRVADQCAAEAACHAAFPDVRGDLAAIRATLRAQPARVTIPHPATGAPTEVTFTDRSFADGLRVMLYSSDTTRAVPYLLSRARQGDLSPFASAAIGSTRGVMRSLRVGLQLSITCSEDVPRIDPGEIAAVTSGSFYGDARVRNQIGICETWPRDARAAASMARPFTSNVPTVLASGDLDPVTPPEWGEATQRYLPNSVLIVHPQGHVAGGDCADGIGAALFLSGTIEGLDTSCLAAITLPPFVLTAADYERLQQQ